MLLTFPYLLFFFCSPGFCWLFHWADAFLSCGNLMSVALVSSRKRIMSFTCPDTLVPASSSNSNTFCCLTVLMKSFSSLWANKEGKSPFLLPPERLLHLGLLADHIHLWKFYFFSSLLGLHVVHECLFLFTAVLASVEWPQDDSSLII